MAISQREIMDRIAKALETTVNKFREHPYYFFTESDIVSYMWKELYSTKLDMGKTRSDKKRIYLVHREYPTNFRYKKKELGPQYIPDGTGGRGHYDLVVLNPEFVERQSVEHVVNKTFDMTKKRACELECFDDEILVAMEFKYVISNNVAFVTQVHQDNHKLRIARSPANDRQVSTSHGTLPRTQGGVMNAMNLVFCNCRLKKDQRKDLIDAVRKPPKGVQALFVESYYDGDEKVLNPVIRA